MITRLKYLVLVLFYFFTFNAFSQSRRIKPPAPVPPLPSEAQLKWHEMEMNAFLHFTTNTFTDKEWGYGDESEKVFNPTEVNTEQWISTLKDAGFKMAILTCKHHDGFCLWPSKYTEHSIKNSPYKNGQGDIVREVSDACRKYGLKFGIYLSPWDRNRADYGTPSYITYYRNQLKELFASYGPVTEMWFDGANGGDGYYGGANEKRSINGRTYYDWPTTMNIVKQFEPEIIFFSDAGPGVRWVGNEKGIAGETNWNTISTDTLYAGKANVEQLLQTGSPDGKQWVPAEVDVSIRPGWFYHQSEDSLVKTPQQLFDIYLTSVGRGSVLLLNVPPDRRGLFNEKDVESLRGFRAMLDREFADNLLLGAKASASSFRSKADRFSPSNVVDGDKDTYWTTDDGVKNGTLEIELPNISTMKYIVLQEYIRLGQRVANFSVEAWVDGKWKSVANGTTIGYKRILKFDTVRTNKLRISIKESKACPVISNVEAF